MLFRSIGIVARKVFADHHRYTAADLRSLTQLAQQTRADCFVTTEKDIVNLPSAAKFPLPLYWAAIEPEVKEADHFLRWLNQRLQILPEPGAADSQLAPARAGRDSSVSNTGNLSG